MTIPKYILRSIIISNTFCRLSTKLESSSLEETKGERSFLRYKPHDDLKFVELAKVLKEILFIL